MTTIGFGDAANPQTTTERVIAVGCMLVGCGMWAYVLGAVQAKVAALDQDTVQYREDMDALRTFCRQKRLPNEMRLRLKEYFRHRRALLKDVASNRLIEELSPGLRGEVTRYCFSDWLAQVPWVRDGADGFRTTLALSLKPSMYSPTELVSGFDLHVVLRGIVIKDARIITRGQVWGTDVILTASKLRQLEPARTLTYVQLYSISADELGAILNAYPSETRRVRAAALWMALRRGLLWFAREMQATSEAIVEIVRAAREKGVDARRHFAEYDADGSGDLDFFEFRLALAALGFAPADDVLRLLLARFDVDESGRISYEEFCRFFAPEELSCAQRQDMELREMASMNLLGARAEHPNETPRRSMIESLGRSREGDALMAGHTSSGATIVPQRSMSITSDDGSVSGLLSASGASRRASAGSMNSLGVSGGLEAVGSSDGDVGGARGGGGGGGGTLDVGAEQRMVRAVARAVSNDVRKIVREELQSELEDLRNELKGMLAWSQARGGGSLAGAAAVAGRGAPWSSEPVDGDEPVALWPTSSAPRVVDLRPDERATVSHLGQRPLGPTTLAAKARRSQVGADLHD